MSDVCICKYPLMITDKREGQEVEYLAMPLEIIEGGIVPVPDIEVQNTEGLDGIKRRYVAIKWKDITPDLHVKKYDVIGGHIVFAGCELSEALKEDNGNLRCDAKSIYKVLHPYEEWIENHVVEIPSTKR
jgi:hypothetical protein